jgi:hypothetical protein
MERIFAVALACLALASASPAQSPNPEENSPSLSSEAKAAGTDRAIPPTSSNSNEQSKLTEDCEATQAGDNPEIQARVTPEPCQAAQIRSTAHILVPTPEPSSFVLLCIVLIVSLLKKWSSPSSLRPQK